MMVQNKDKKMKILTLLGFISFIISQYLILFHVPNNMHNISIYSEIIIYYWVFYFFALIIGTYLVLEGLNSNYWKLGIIIIFLSNLTIILLPFLKGYDFSGSGDHLTHLGYVKDILYTGHISTHNVYPATHIIISSLVYFSKISPQILLNFISPLFYFLFIIFTYLLACELVDKEPAIIATLISTILSIYYYVQVFPMGYAFLLYPFIFYIYFKNQKQRKISTSVILLLILTVLVIFHLVAAFVMFLAILIMELSQIAYHRFITREITKKKINITLALFLFVVVLLWITNNAYAWQNSISNVIGWMSFEMLTQPLNTVAMAGFNQLNLNVFDIILLFFKKYGVQFFCLIVSLVVIIQLLIKSNFTYVKEREFFYVYMVVFLFSLILWIVDLFIPLTLLTSGRLIALVNSIFPIFVGLGFYRILNSNKISINNIVSRIKIPVATILLVIVFLVGVFSLYPSPAIYSTNDALDNSQTASAIWFNEKESNHISVAILGYVSTDRIQQALNGFSFYTHHYNYPVPDHFDYNTNTYLGNYYNSTTYLLYNEQFILSIYQQGGVFSQIGRFNPNDFQRLDNDTSVNKIYDNGEIDVDLIK